MTHVNLDTQPEAVRQFVLALFVLATVGRQLFA
jgi:hypothetical protein